MSGRWQSPSIAQSAEILQKIHTAEPVTRYGADAALAVMPLGFYADGALLARAQKAQPQAAPQYYVILAREAVPLDGSIANIHHANAAAPLALDEDNIEDYLAFRLYFGSAAEMLRARCEKTADGWQATLRARDGAGTHEMTLMVSPRGEVSESHKELRSEDAATPLPPFGSGGETA